MASSICSIHTFSPCSVRDPRFRRPESRFTHANFAIRSCMKPNCSVTTLRCRFGFGFDLRRLNLRVDRRRIRSVVVAGGPMFFPENPVVGDAFAMVFSGCFALSILRVYEETARRGIFDQKLNRKLVHTTIGLAFMLCWPLFSSGYQGAVMAALIPGVNIVKVLLIGLGIWKDEATVKSMSRDGDYRELIKGPLYYASTIALSSLIYWRTSPIAIAAICNLCAGDGMADIIGRRFGTKKIPYNKDKSFAGSIAMAAAGFIVSVGYMHYFSMFGYFEVSWQMIFGFLVVSVACALVESHPISTTFDDNLMAVKLHAKMQKLCDLALLLCYNHR
ncbi:probable phytol kinase 3, chloroplastic isoform X2 [Helianthus annuus]|uniref:probable phytol kinase 3, chloroplastic isoform X2 n=1 Tax=Helianthus annuus TaxID=4232 RepID=UPI000B8F6587|nr:probable phytol kinase 3, chloroplastic isoform X2 [Helianthus annuus]